MKSIRDQQSPQSNPWPLMRVRHEMQTGGSRRSANDATMPRRPRIAEPVPGLASGAGELSSASSIAMRDMIEPRPGQ